MTTLLEVPAKCRNARPVVGTSRYGAVMRGTSLLGIATVLLLGCAEHPTQPIQAPTISRSGDAKATPASRTSPPQDTDQPEYWLERLVDPNQQAQCVERLTLAYDTAMAHANGEGSGEEPRALVDRIVLPLTDAYIRNYVVFDTKTRANLVKLLSRFNDPRAEPAFKKAIGGYLQLLPTDRESLDLKWAASAVGAMKLQSCYELLFEAFLRLRASTMLGGSTYREVYGALDQIPQKNWTARLCKVLESRIDVPMNAQERHKLDAYKDQLFWQPTAARLLGLLGDSAAVEPLLRVMLDPNKSDVQATALLALVKLGRPALERSVKLLRGEDPILQKFHLERLASSNHKEARQDAGESQVRTAALVLGTIGRPEAAAPLIAAMDRSRNDATRAVLAREITKLPKSAETLAAFSRAFERLEPRVRMPPGVNALVLLTECSVQFHDPSLFPWLLTQLNRIAGRDEESAGVRASIRMAMLKIADVGQLELLRQVYQRDVAQDEQERLALIAPVLQQCRDNLDCYLTELSKPDNQTEQRQIVAMKAAIMIGAFGRETDSIRLIERLGQISNAAARYVVAGSIDHLLPRGDADVADWLGRVIRANEQTNDRNLISSDAPLKQMMYRIRTRTQ